MFHFFVFCGICFFVIFVGFGIRFRVRWGPSGPTSPNPSFLFCLCCCQETKERPCSFSFKGFGSFFSQTPLFECFFFSFFFFVFFFFPFNLSSSLPFTSSWSIIIISFFFSFSLFLSSFSSSFASFLVYYFHPNPFLTPLLFGAHVAFIVWLFCCYFLALLLAFAVLQKSLFWYRSRVATKRCFLRSPCFQTVKS